VAAWYLNPYVQLATQVAAVVFAVVVAWAILWSGTTVGRGASLAAVAAAAAAVLLAAALPTRVLSSAQSLGAIRETLATEPGRSSHDLCLRTPSMARFVKWLKTRMPEDATFATEGPIDRVCMQLNMFPRRLVPTSGRQEWTVVAGPIPPELRRRARQVLLFAPDQALLRGG
jgi:hypothetical protein